MPDSEQQWEEGDLEEDLTDKRATKEKSLYLPDLPSQEIWEKVSQTAATQGHSGWVMCPSLGTELKKKKQKPKHRTFC